MNLTDDRICVPCKKIGLTRKAHRVMPGGGGRCDEHFREEQGLPQLNEAAKAFIAHCKEYEQTQSGPKPKPPDWKPTEKNKVTVDCVAMQKDRDAGMKPKDLAEKYGVNYGYVMNHTTKPKNSTPAHEAVQEAQTHFQKSAKSVAKVNFVNVIEELKEKRAEYQDKIAKIDSVIASLLEI